MKLGIALRKTEYQNAVYPQNLLCNHIPTCTEYIKYFKIYKNIRKSQKLMNYNQIEEYILNIPKFRPEGSIEQTRKFYEFLGKPGKSVNLVHVAGTNGKGSTCAYMNSVLTEAGYKVGMFTSPHLVSVRERMRINQELISEQEFVDIFSKLEGKIGCYNQGCGLIVNTETDIAIDKDEYDRGVGTVEEVSKEQEQINIKEQYLPTFYEFLFFMAMLYFEEQNTDIIILETGLGGRLDATNVIDAPKVAVITEIGKDHMEYLGDTFEKIAEEKAGIIKSGSAVVYSGNRQEVVEVIERKAKELDVLCKCMEKIEKEDYRFVDKKIDFSFYSRYYGYIPISVSTCAIYQVENVCLALAAIEELELKISKEAMQSGIKRCKWEGRMEEILPGVFLDGAHNEDGIDAFVTSVKADGCKGRRWLLFSAVADKEYKIMKDKLIKSDLFDYVFASPLKTARGISKDELKEIFAQTSLENTVSDRKVGISDSAYEGFGKILSLKKDEDFVYVTGSLYLVGEIKEKCSEAQPKVV